MIPPEPSVYHATSLPSSVVREDTIEDGFIHTLRNLKYEYRRDIRDRATLERNFREKFEALNRVRLTDAEFARLLDEIISADVFTASKTLIYLQTTRSCWKSKKRSDWPGTATMPS